MTKKLLYLFFVLFSLLDLYLTNHFLNNTNIKELNPIASFMFSNFGLIGLMILKVISIITFVTCCIFIGKNKKPIVEKKVLTFGLSIMVFVVLYSWYAIATEHVIFKTLDYCLHQIHYYSHQQIFINYMNNIIIAIVGFILLFIICFAVKILFFTCMKNTNKKYEDYEGIDYDE